GDVVPGDRGFCSYAHIALLVGRGLHAVFRVHQQQIVDFTPGRPKAAREWPWANPKRLPHSRWVLAHGPSDQVVVWSKPRGRPAMAGSARARGVAPERVSLVDAVRWLGGPDGGEDVSVLLVNPSRPGRVEPRVVKRRPKQYFRLTKPRAELRKELPNKYY